MTRLLNTPIIGPSTAIVDSSWIDMLAGLSPIGILRMPPGFWANPLWHKQSQIGNPATAANIQSFFFMGVHAWAGMGFLHHAAPVSSWLGDYLSSQTSSKREPL